jgi:hypothetical protein
MRFLFSIAVVISAGLFGQVPEGGLKPNEKPATDKLGLPPRVAPTEYQAQGKAGEITIGAEFAQHSVPTPEGPLSTEEYVVVEAGFFGAPGARLQLSPGDFSLRINGNKKTTPAEPYGLVVDSVKDPEWVPEVKQEKGGKTSFGSGGRGGGGDSGPPTPPKVPFDVQRKLAIRVKKASMPEGDRALPEAGLLYFKYRGKEKSIHSLELIYSGPAGQATLELHP